MKRIYLTGFALVAGCVVAPISGAQAQVNKTGCFFGLQAGYGWGKGELVNSAVPDIKADGAAVGVLAGCDYWQGPVVLGVEADAVYGPHSGSVMDGNYLSFHGKQDWTVAAVARAGILLQDYRTVLYVAGGPTAKRVEAGMRCPAGALFGVCSVTGPFNASDTKWMSGWTARVGLDYYLPEWGASLGIQYRYDRYSPETFTVQTPLGPSSGKSAQVEHSVFARIIKHY